MNRNVNDTISILENSMGEKMADYDFPGKIVTLSGNELTKIKPGPLRRAELDPVLIAWARRLFGSVGRHVCQTFEQWEIGFLRDLDPANEMLVWEAICLACDTYTASHPNADRQATVYKLSVISIHSEFHRETDVTRELRRLFKIAWHGLAKDRVATMNKIARSLGVFDGNA